MPAGLDATPAVDWNAGAGGARERTGRAGTPRTVDLDVAGQMDAAWSRSAPTRLDAARPSRDRAASARLSAVVPGEGSQGLS
jgi:hypothetical protein